jgi:hypothetical protein
MLLIIHFIRLKYENIIQRKVVALIKMAIAVVTVLHVFGHAAGRPASMILAVREYTGACEQVE